MLAGVSLDYYTRLERGNIRGASESVLNAIARALQLNDVEREHLFDLARTATRHRCRATSPQGRTAAVRASVQRVLDNLAVPAIVYNAQQDLIASNLMGRALFSPHFEADRPNLARFIFLDPRARDYYADWPLARSMTAAMLRLEAGRDPLNSDLTALIGELSTRSPQFRTDWADQDVHEHRTGRRSTATPRSARSTSPSTSSNCPANQACPSPPTASKTASDRRQVRAAGHLGSDPGSTHLTRISGPTMRRSKRFIGFGQYPCKSLKAFETSHLMPLANPRQARIPEGSGPVDALGSGSLGGEREDDHQNRTQSQPVAIRVGQRGNPCASAARGRPLARSTDLQRTPLADVEPSRSSPQPCAGRPRGHADDGFDVDSTSRYVLQPKKRSSGPR